MVFRTQKELLEHFNKPADARIYVSRWLASGKVVKVDGGYEIVALGSSGDSNLEADLERYKKGYDKSVEDYNKLLEKYNGLKSEYDEWLNKEEKPDSSNSSESSDSDVDWNTYVKALNRLEVKDNYIYWLQMQIKKMVDPKGEKDEGDIISALNSDGGYDPHDENYL